MKAVALSRGNGGGITAGSGAKGVELQAWGCWLVDNVYCSGEASHIKSSSDELSLDVTSESEWLELVS